MIIRTVDDQGDWVFGRGRQSYLRNLDALRQDIRSRLLLWKGECFFATAEGVDWNNYLDRGTAALLYRDIRRVISQTGGVLRTRAFRATLESEAREVSVEVELDTIYGSLALQEVL